MGKDLTCGRGEWQNARNYDVAWFRSNSIGPDHPRYHAPSQNDLGSFSAPAEPEFGSQPLPYMGPLKIGDGKTYTPTADDVGKLVYCQVSATNDGATVWKSAPAPAIVG